METSFADKIVAEKTAESYLCGLLSYVIVLQTKATFEAFMAGVAQLVEHQIVTLGAAGSSPVTRPRKT